MMKKVERQFFALLKSGLWGGYPEAELFDAPADWEQIYTIANRQTVLGIVGDGIAQQVAHPGIDAANKAPAEFRKKFLVQVVKAERRNEKLNQFIVRYNQIFTAAGITPVIVKGQGVALTYPQPMHRQSGDIDYLLMPEEYEKAKEMLAPLATHVEKETPGRMHYNCTVDGITVELHGISSGRTGWKGVFDGFMREQRALPLHYWQLQDEKIPLMNHYFNVLYILQHFHRHMLSSGVGLRQLCDWIMYISAFREVLDEPVLEKDLKRLSLLRPWKVYAALAVAYMGMPAERMPLYEKSYERYSARVWRIMSITGNFGKYDGGRPAAAIPLLPR